jgi:heme oxygenase
LQKAFDELILDDDFKELYKKLHRKGLDQVDFFVSSNLSFLLERCEEFPIEHSYLFYLGLLMGGNLLSKCLPQHKDFLKFGTIIEAKQLIKDFKQYLNDTIQSDTEQEIFIGRINTSYKIIKLVFDDYYK